MGDVSETLARILAGTQAWESADGGLLAALPAAAAEHGVEALLWEALSGAAAGTDVRQKLTPIVRAAVARDVFVQRDLQVVTEALAAEGVPALVVKGSALAYTCYPEPWLRPRVDTDLFVRPGDVAAAARVLQRCGYTRSDATNTGSLVSHQVSFERESDGVRQVIDLHWKLVNPQIVADALPFDELWASSREASAIGSAARVPGTIDSIAIACVHRLAHHQGQDRLVWLYDIHLLAGSLSPVDWESLRASACARGIAGLCADGLRSARRLFGSAFPGHIETALDEASVSEPSRIYLEGQVTKSDVLISDLKVLPTWGGRLRLLREHVLPPAAFIRQRYRTQTRMMLPALYLHRLITGASRWVRS